MCEINHLARQKLYVFRIYLFKIKKIFMRYRNPKLMTSVNI
ncbi:Hypothetical protein BN2458_PEG0890 [Helicobacter typhlonius]|uniref:Uncharacterized protein n=1 Tax=Helicobacter typhlonius TaxID=76936 RepID=A0A0S4PTZ5_9HELI|nr:Hypothetical protein BN2458_PEG0890 [Helicobacter typhlonius]